MKTISLNSLTQSVNINPMGLLDKAQKKKNKKDPGIRIQATISPELHAEVDEILKSRGLNWQIVIHAAIESVKDEAKRK